jgi:hypothetical protein
LLFDYLVGAGERKSFSQVPVLRTLGQPVRLVLGTPSHHHLFIGLENFPRSSWLAVAAHVEVANEIVLAGNFLLHESI